MFFSKHKYINNLDIIYIKFNYENRSNTLDRFLDNYRNEYS